MAKGIQYTDHELKNWWARLSHAERNEILGVMMERGRDPDFGASLADQYNRGRELSPKQLAAIRKWARE